MAKSQYVVEIKQSARKELERLPNALIARIFAKIEALQDDPRPAGCKKLKGDEATYRIRIGDYRVVYTIDDGKILVTVIRIRHRREVYE
ncbi:MAG: type II toxin-antitoxin system RelE/ParE family toxin [Acidobacteriaceae bacterium]|nr:type II toxin-antitoxin system RelE/ParE family toxin [Acidobacteriaceae bacterium]